MRGIHTDSVLWCPAQCRKCCWFLAVLHESSGDSGDDILLSNVAPFSRHGFWWTVPCGRRTRSIWNEKVLFILPLHWLIWQIMLLSISTPPPTPTKAYCSEVSSQSIFRWDVFKDDRSPSSLVCYNECVFSVNGVWFPHFQLPHTSSGSIGPSAPWGASVWSRRMGLLHMGQTLRISSHLSRHLAGKKWHEFKGKSSGVIYEPSRKTSNRCWLNYILCKL